MFPVSPRSIVHEGLWILLCLLVFGGCTMFGPAEPPAWVMGSSERFPDDQYLVGVGEGDSRTLAEQRAYAAVSRIFEANIRSLFRDTETYSVSNTQATQTRARRLNLEQMTQVTTQKVLENVRILDVWYREESKAYFVLAGLDRAQSETILVDKLREFDRQIQEELAAERDAVNPLAKIRHLKRALNQLRLRDLINADLRVIRPSGVGERAPYHREDIRPRLDTLLGQELAIEVRLQGELRDQLREAVWEGLNREGFVAALQPQGEGASQGSPALPPDLTIEGGGKTWKVDVPDPLFVYVRWCTEFQVIDRQENRLIGLVSRSGRVGHITLAEARVRAIQTIQATVTEELAGVLADFIYAEPKPVDLGPKPACPYAKPD